MPLRVLSLCTYPIDFLHMRNQDWCAQKFIKALKGDPINGYANIPVDGVSRYLDEGNKEDAFGFFAKMAAPLFEQLRSRGHAAFVPVPSSDTTLKTTNCADTTTFRLAAALVDEFAGRAHVADLLRWKKPIPSARRHQGPREPAELYPLLGFRGGESQGKHILVDDVVTSGGHLRACARVLADNGVIAEWAIVAGRTTYEPEANAFGVQTREFEDFDPNEPDWFG